MLPIYLLTHAKGQPLLVELKSGETVNGILVAADSWMNVTLQDAIETSPDGETFTKLSEILVKGKDIKYLRLPQELIPEVKAMNNKNQSQGRNRNNMGNNMNSNNNDRRNNYSNNNQNRQGGTRGGFGQNRQGGNSQNRRGGRFSGQNQSREHNENREKNPRPQ